MDIGIDFLGNTCRPLKAGLTGNGLDIAQSEIRRKINLERNVNTKTYMGLLLSRCNELTRQAILQSQTGDTSTWLFSKIYEDLTLRLSKFEFRDA
ncbi:hypothetical protein GJ496_001972 [Pomphorhynchus laevis]|nr:hypothetical protein GJ496_001972 [Pomphorhynchus laevis]